MANLEADYDLTLDDVLTFAGNQRRQTHGVRHPWLKRGLAALIAVVIMIIEVSFRDSEWENLAKVPILLLSTVLFLTLYAAMPAAWLRWQSSLILRRNFAKDPYFWKQLARQRMILTPAGVERHSGTGDSFAPWDTYDRVEMTNEYLFFYQSANRGFPVPRRAFADEETFRDFGEYARACIEKAKMHTI